MREYDSLGSYSSWAKEFAPKHFEHAISLDIPALWHPTIIEATKKIIEIDPDIEIVQVKSKFGRLRYYTQPYDLKIEEIVIEAENKIAAIEKEIKERK